MLGAWHEKRTTRTLPTLNTVNSKPCCPYPLRRGVLPRRWVVERTLSWFGGSRRLSKDYERLCATSEAQMYLVMSRVMLRRLARA